MCQEGIKLLDIIRAVHSTACLEMPRAKHVCFWRASGLGQGSANKHVQHDQQPLSMGCAALLLFTNVSCDVVVVRLDVQQREPGKVLRLFARAPACMQRLCWLQVDGNATQCATASLRSYTLLHLA